MELKELGLTTRTINRLKAKNILTPSDLLETLPRGYDDLRRLTGVRTGVGELSVFTAVVTAVDYRPQAKQRITASCLCTEENITVQVTWLRQPYRYAPIQALLHREVLVAGHVQYSAAYRSYSLFQPELFEDAGDSGSLRIRPVYRAVPGLSQDSMRKTVDQVLQALPDQPDPLPADILVREGLVPRRLAYRYLHQPETMEQVEQGKQRLLYDDLLYFAMKNEWARRQTTGGTELVLRSTALPERIRAGLPYALTEDQDAVLTELLDRAREGQRINAILQGDTGVGKSIVMLLLAAAFVDSGYQAAVMAPTQVLARQHYADAVKLFEPFGVSVVCLDGSTDRRTMTALLRQIRSGEAQLIVGTHAVMGRPVEYRNLAFVATDEEHKFGVQQRSNLVLKASDGVHCLTMSATPIPRSLASAVYGSSVELFTIRTRPANRKPVITKLCHNRPSVYSFLLRQIRQGHQAYVVCPMIDDSEKLEGVRSVESLLADYRAAFEPEGVVVESLTGRCTAEEAQNLLRRFRAGEIQILIATTVIEVGVNVPNATTIVIESAERFGLASLHQLRGRVGRSDLQSYCFPLTETGDGDANQRLAALCATDDGFELAKTDLALRGPGDLLGKAQSGLDNRYMQLVLAYPERYEHSKEIAAELLDRGPGICGLVRRVLEADDDIL